jgi:hypothetical protein
MHESKQSYRAFAQTILPAGLSCVGDCTFGCWVGCRVQAPTCGVRGTQELLNCCTSDSRTTFRALTDQFGHPAALFIRLWMNVRQSYCVRGHNRPNSPISRAICPSENVKVASATDTSDRLLPTSTFARRIGCQKQVDERRMVSVLHLPSDL